MGAATLGSPGILALLPYLVKGALSLAVLREMHDRGIDVTIAYHLAGSGGYTGDGAGDFASRDRLLDMTGGSGVEAVDRLEQAVTARNIGLVLQIGAPAAYHRLPYLRERRPGLQIVDTLYNKVGHSLNHFLYEACFDGVIVESQDMRRFVMASTAKADAGVHLVESGIALDGFAPRPIGTDAHGSRRLVIGYLGRMSPEKNPLGFVELAERLHDTTPGLAFRLYGEGPMAGEVQARIAAGPASGAIIFEGFAETSAAALAQIDVLVVPSRLDGRPNVIMEANACAIPVIGAAVGGIPELIQPGVNGALLAPEQHGDIAALLRRWMSDPDEFAAIRRSARATAEARFDRRRMMDAYEALYRRFLEISARAARP